MALTVPAAAAPLFETGLSADFESVSAFETRMDGPWSIEVFAGRAPDKASLTARIAILAAAAGIVMPPFTVEALPPTDWLAASFAAFPPFAIGRFRIRGSHVDAPARAGQIDLRIDAATAFGSGEHPTTEGCLRALLDLHRRLSRTRPRVLDLGCGTGILAFAAARLWRVPVLASDIDAQSVRVARLNARANGVAGFEGGRVRVVPAAGYRHPAIAAARPFDLVLANILAGPLCRLAPELARHLAPGGRAVLSGLLTRQAAQVLAAHRAQGLRLEGRRVIGAWTTLILRRPAAQAGRASPVRARTAFRP